MTEQKEGIEQFFDSEEQPGVEYIKPNLDLKLSDRHKSECREIVLEIKKFGVNQRQLLFIVDLLSLELENLQTTKEIRAAIRNARSLSDEGASGLIIPTGDS
jgi:hypothetical protein